MILANLQTTPWGDALRRRRVSRGVSASQLPSRARQQGVLLTLLAATCINAQPLPTAESVLDHFIEVTGGKATYLRHKTEVLHGNLTFSAQGLTGKLTRYAASPDKEYSVVELGQLGKIESGFSGGVGWEKSAILGPRIKGGEELALAAREAHFNQDLDWRSIYSKVEMLGSENAEGEECFKLGLTPKSGRPETRFYSKASGLLVKTVMTAVSPMGDVNVEVTATDYKPFSGILVPTHSKQKASGQELEVAITSIAFDEPIPAEYFDVPVDVKAKLPKAPAASK